MIKKQRNKEENQHTFQDEKRFFLDLCKTPILENYCPIVVSNHAKKIHKQHRHLRRLDGEGPLGEVRLALLGLGQGAGGILGGQPPADGTGLLRSQVQGQVLLVLVEEAELGALLGVDDGQDAGNRLADVTTARS
jgi:hypothetical protein